MCSTNSASMVQQAYKLVYAWHGCCLNNVWCMLTSADSQQQHFLVRQLKASSTLTILTTKSSIKSSNLKKFKIQVASHKFLTLNTSHFSSKVKDLLVQEYKLINVSDTRNFKAKRLQYNTTYLCTEIQLMFISISSLS